MVVFRPLHDRVAVRRLEAEEKSAGGIIIPDTAQEKPQQGEVVAVGDGLRSESGGMSSPTTRIAADMSPRLSPPAVAPDLSEANRRLARCPLDVVNPFTVASTTASL